MPFHRHIAIASLAVALTGAAGLAYAQNKGPAEKKIYCWNEGGRKVCGDALPASAVDSARTEYSLKSGRATSDVGRALSGSERSEALAAAEAARRQAEAEATLKRRDLAMVESYMTEADLRKAYGERTTLLEETIKASSLGISNLRLSLITLLRQAGDAELDGQPVRRDLVATIQQQHAELMRQRQLLAAQKVDHSELAHELEASVQRYRAMRKPDSGAPAPGKAPPPAPAPAAKPAAG